MSDELNSSLDADPNPSAGDAIDASIADRGGPDAPAPGEDGPITDADLTPTPSPASAADTQSTAASGQPAAPATPPTPAAPAAPPAAPAFSFRQYAQQNGLPVGGYQTEEEAARATMAWMRQLQEQANQFQQIQQHPGYAALAQPPAPPKPEPLYKAPEFDPRWAAAVRTDPQTGRTFIDPESGFGPEILPKLRAWKEHQVETFNKFVTDPQAFLQPLMDAQQQRMQQTFDREFEVRQNRYQAEQYFAQNASRFYNNGDPRQGYTPEGQVFDLVIKGLGKAKFVGNMQETLGFAELATLGYLAKMNQGQPAAPAAPQNPAPQPGTTNVTTTLNPGNTPNYVSPAATHSPSTGASRNQAPVVPGETLNLRNMLTEAMKGHGEISIDH